MKSNIIAHNLVGNNLTVVYRRPDGSPKSEIINNTHPNWSAVMDAYKAAKYDELIPLLNIATCINAKSNGKFEVIDGKVYYNGHETHGYLFERILFFLKEFPKQYPRLVKFAENLYKNPDENVRNDLYKFLEHGGNPITEDGYFLAYKGVSNNYYSITSGNLKLLKGQTKPDGQSGNTFVYNGVGEVIEVDRSQVNPNGNEGCSYGLHAGSFSYADGFKGSGRLVIVKVNPADVVSVPQDESFQKLRTCRYEVIAEEGKKLDEGKNMNYDKAAKVRYHNRRGPDGKFLSANAPQRDAKGRFVSAS